MARLTELQKQAINQLSSKGWSSRDIAEVVIGRRSAKSTVGDEIERQFFDKIVKAAFE